MGVFIRNIPDDREKDIKNWLSTARKTRYLETVAGYVFHASLKDKRLTIDLRGEENTELRIFVKPGRLGIEAFCLLQAGDLVEVTGYYRQTGGMQGQTISFVGLSERDMDNRRMLAGPKLAELL
jgi:hypothetical protein